jgi:hypothetical protein
VLIWTDGRHSFGVGFHDVSGFAGTQKLDEELVRGSSSSGTK